MPLLRSHSMPSSTSQGESSSSGTMSPRGYRLCHSFDEQQAVVAEMRIGHAQRMLRRQPAIEVPLGAEQLLEEAGQASSSIRGAERPRQPQEEQPRSLNQVECEACRSHFQYADLEVHRRTCPGQKSLEQQSRDGGKTCKEDRPPMMMHYKFRALAMAVRKRRKEESLEEDPPHPGSAPAPGSPAGVIALQSRPDHSPPTSGLYVGLSARI